MTAVDVSSAAAAVFVVGMIWLRTRMQYLGLARSDPAAGETRRTRGLELRRAGWYYFGSAIVVLALGWLVAPLVGARFWPQAGASPPLTRIIWFLLTYYVFIVVHRSLRTRGIAVFTVRDEA